MTLLQRAPDEMAIGVMKACANKHQEEMQGFNLYNRTERKRKKEKERERKRKKEKERERKRKKEKERI